jgi:hypothetical protein
MVYETTGDDLSIFGAKIFHINSKELYGVLYHDDLGNFGLKNVLCLLLVTEYNYGVLSDVTGLFSKSLGLSTWGV